MTFEATEQTKEDLRSPDVALAVVAAIVGPGLGYLYVGRPRLAFSSVALAVAVVVFVCVTRLVVTPAGLYTTAAVLAVLYATSIIHPALIAREASEQGAVVAHRVSMYVAWLVTAYVLGFVWLDNRAWLFGYETYSVPSASMAPTVVRGDHVMADTWYYRASSPAVGDIVIFEVPRNPGVHFLKRVVGLPGDTIEIRDNELIRNDKRLVEDYIQLKSPADPRHSNFGPVEVPDDHYFVLGDNRHNSNDSRYFGAIHEDLVHGRVEYRWYAYHQGIDWARFPYTFRHGAE